MKLKIEILEEKFKLLVLDLVLENLKI